MPYPKRYYYLGLIAYSILLVFAILFYKERTIFTDISYHLFFILKDSSLCIQNYRFGAAVTQAFPLFAGKLNIPLQGVVVIYSIGFAVYYFFVYLVCGVVFKNYRMGLVMLLFSTLFVSETFYWMQSELPQGLAFLILVFGFLTSDRTYKKNIIAIVLTCAALVTVAFFHPLLMFAFLYTCLFFAFSREPKVKGLLLYFLVYAAAIAVKNIYFATAYDSSAMNKINSFADRWTLFWKLYSNKRFLLFCLNRYYWIPILFVATIVAYGIQRSWMKLALFVSFVLGYYVLVNMSFPDETTTANYIENAYLPISIFLALPLVYDIMPALQGRKLAMPVFLLIVVGGIIRIFSFHTGFTDRLAWEDALLTKYANKKVVIDSKDVPKEKLIATWGSPHEFWLLSTLKYGKTASIIIADGPDRITEWMEYRDRFVMLWGTAPYSELKSRYFNFTDTVTKYELVMP